MKDKKFLALLSVIGIIIVVMFIYYLTMDKDDIMLNNSNNINTKESTNNNVVNRNIFEDLSFVDDKNRFFDVNSSLNVYFDYIEKNNDGAILNILNSEYIEKNNITINNIYDFVDGSFQDITFYSKKIYQKRINNTYYYFIDGSLHLYNQYTEIMNQKNNVTLMLIYDSINNNFDVTPLSLSSSLVEFAKDYQIVEKNIILNNDNSFRHSDIKKSNIGIFYLSYFKNILYLNTEEAYSMISDDMKKQYYSLEIFTNNLSDIYKKCNTNYISYSVDEKEKEVIYKYQTKDLVNVTISEKITMDFVIDLKNN